MPTNQNAYNSRVTDESLEKRFRDTFRSQGGAELVDDLYASGVIVPVVDFTAAATGQQLAENLQTAWDFSTGFNQATNNTVTLISNAGFWKVNVVLCMEIESAANRKGLLSITDGLSSKIIWIAEETASVADYTTSIANEIVVFLRSGDSLTATTNGGGATLNASYRQIATLNGDLVNPSGFTSS